MSARSGIRMTFALALLAWPAVGVAQTKTGTTLGQFLLIEPSARFTAIGNSGVTADGSLEGAYYNPASPGRVSRLEFQLAHVDWLAGIRFDYLAFGIPLKNWGTGYATLTSLNSGEIDVRTVSQPLGTGERYSVSDFALGVGFARAITDRFSAGIQVRYFQERIWHSSADAVTFDVGTVYRIRPDGLYIGSSITNFGTGASFSGRDLNITYDNVPGQNGDNGTLPGGRSVSAYDVPVLFRAGVGLPLKLSPEWKLWISAEAHHANYNPESVNGGVEATYKDFLSLRAGYQGLFIKDSEEGLALGTGIGGRLNSYGYQIDYAWADHGLLGSVHRLSLAFRH